ncbi:HEAT repeat domain-containing protein [Robiginitalea myxolifaciens]|nr:HEAT repeat domain-containing protein [Robiginitalea myxolifaciens]
MKESEYEKLSIAFLNGELSEKEAQEFQAFLTANPEKEQEINDMRVLWGHLETAPVPEASRQAISNFEDVLDSRIQDETQPIAITRGKSGTTEIPNWLLAACLLLGGFLLGRYVFQPGSPTEPMPTPGVELVDTNTSPEESGSAPDAILTLLEEPIASRRLQGVNQVAEMSSADEQVIRALLQTLITDSNVNVRLAAVEVLKGYTDIPIVREGLVSAIPHQDSPMLQITLAALMAEIQEQSSVAPLRIIIEKEQTDSIVRRALEESVKQII